MNQPFLPMRRKVLLGMGAGIGALAIPALAMRLDTPAGATPTTRPVTPGFLTVSYRLTERTTLDPGMAARLESALTARDPAFPASIVALAGLLSSNPAVPVPELLGRNPVQPPAVVDAANAVLAGWYLGVAGNAPDAPVVTYFDALMFDPVRDAVAPPSYCRQAPGYWTARPPAA